MPATPLPRRKPAVTAGQLMRRRLRELRRTPRELADAVEVPEAYIADLLTGRRHPPAPGRTDVYERVTRFLRLHRNDLSSCVRGERTVSTTTRRRVDPRVRRLLFELCDPTRTRVLARRATGELERLIAQRLLEVGHSFVRRQLDDHVGMRVAARREGCGYAELRMRLLEFLDTGAESLTPAHYEAFVRPRIAMWDFDLDTRAMRIVLRSQEVTPPGRRVQGL
ncbi:MAG: hypothetical protein ACREMV_14805 [Gemmatimonadales bacterium]